MLTRQPLCDNSRSVIIFKLKLHLILILFLIKLLFLNYYYYIINLKCKYIIKFSLIIDLSYIKQIFICILAKNLYGNSWALIRTSIISYLIS